MAHPLFLEIDKFEAWAKVMLVEPSKISAEWETDYLEWSALDEQFKDFIGTVPSSSWNTDELNRLTYIIARDNECEQLIGSLPDDALVALAEFAMAHGEHDAKWQLADALPRIHDKQKASALIEGFVNDPEEYVNRRALMALGKVDGKKAELYCKAHWDRNLYGDVGEYQRMAVLSTLKEIGSPLLAHYLDLAKTDGRPYLVNLAREIEQEA